MLERSDFLIPDGTLYLNSGTLAYTPRSVQRAIRDYQDSAEASPAQGLFSAWRNTWKVQCDLAAFLNARPEHLFLRTNVTYAMNDFILALEIPKDSEILVSDVEYGAIVNICRYKAELEGHSVKTMHVPSRGDELFGLSPKALVDGFERAISKKTKLVVLSHVTTGSGLRLPIEEFAAICRSRGIVFAADGAHGMGSVPLDLSKTQVDFYGSNLHKWMMGPKGTGWGWVAPEIRNRLKPKFAGWTTYELPSPFAAFGGGDPWTTRWMISSSHNFSDFYAISDTLDLWLKHGPAEIMARQRRLLEFAKKTVSDKTEWNCLSRFPDFLSGPLAAFELPDSLEREGFGLIDRLKDQHQLHISMTFIQGRWCLRITPHIYNTEAEIERAAEILKGL